VPAWESTVLRRSTKGFYGSCWEKMPDRWHTQDWLLHYDNMACHTHSWLILVLKYRNMVKGMKIQGCHENKAESQAALERIAKQEFQMCFQL